MSDDEIPWYSPNAYRARKGIPRSRRRGDVVWTLHRDGRTQSCELMDDSNHGGAFDVIVLENSELLFSVRAADQDGAQHFAEAFRQDLLRTGWSHHPEGDE